jgi:hypothetical protein
MKVSLLDYLIYGTSFIGVVSLLEQLGVLKFVASFMKVLP